MSAKIYGVPPSMNCAGPIVLALEAKAGQMEYLDIMSGSHKTPEYAAVNAYQQVPGLEDGDVKIGQSNAILRYLAMKYKPEAYPVGEPEKCAKIDYALESFSDFVYPGHKKTVYGVFGFMAPPDDQKAANAEYVAACDKWLATFVGDKKFCCGDTPSIADYKAVPFFFSAIQPVMKKKIDLELSEKVSKYVADFCAAVGASAFMESAGGFSIKEFAASKE